MAHSAIRKADFACKGAYLLCALALLVSACEEEAVSSMGGEGQENNLCSVPPSQLVFSTVPDAIVPLVDPELVSASEETRVEAEEFVLGFVVADSAIAVPVSILRWHEIVNFDVSSHRLAVTYCPLTGSGIIFDRSSIGDSEFGNAGLLYKNNLVLYDRQPTRSFFSQMGLQGICGSKRAAPVSTFPVLETTWSGWKEMYPNTSVVSRNTGVSRNYDGNPYVRYAEVGNTQIFFPMPAPIDQRRPPKERVLAIPDGSGGLAFPMQELDDGSPVRVVYPSEADTLVVFFDREKRTAAAYRAGSESFRVDEGSIVDETGTEWTVGGLTVDGALDGRRLEPAARSYIAYWFAWAAFHPEMEIWESR